MFQSGRDLYYRPFIMCGRFTSLTPEPLVRAASLLEAGESRSSGHILQPRYNIAPSQDIAIVRDTGSGRELVMARWGWFRTGQRHRKSSIR